MNKDLSNFAARVREAISSGGHCFVNAPLGQGSDQALPSGSADGSFNRYALELFALQFRHNPAYRKICESRRFTPDIAGHWTEIPAVPTAAFKELELSCIPLEERTAVFHSSGTTEQVPSRHFHGRDSLALYGTSLWHWFERHVLPEFGVRSSEFGVLILAPPPGRAPHSSLVHMFEAICRKLGAPESAFVGQAVAGSWILDVDATLAALNSARETRHSTLVLGTAFSFVHLLDVLVERDLRFQLPNGSRVMETGGYKNRSRSMPKEQLHALITERLGVPPENIICEYGMSELSSQAYAMGAPASSRHVASEPDKLAGRMPALPGFRFPPWAQIQVISPETGSEVADGQAGLIRVFDLANAFSVMAVQTEDLGIRRGDGFEWMGRARTAQPRGCSLMMLEGSASSLP